MDSANHEESEAEVLDDGAAEVRPARLLIALLLRYPEIGRVCMNPESATLALSFLLVDEPLTRVFDQFHADARRALAMFGRLEGRTATRRLEVALRQQGPLTVLDVVREIRDLAVEEFAILMGMVQQSFGNLLIVEGRRDGHDPIVIDDDSSLVQGLSHAKSAPWDDPLVGIRQDGRVLVYAAM